MKNKKIKLQYINNVARKDLLEIEVAENVQLEQLLLSFEPALKEKCQSFELDNFYIKDQILCKLDQNIWEGYFQRNEELVIIYSDIVNLDLAGHFEHCQGKNGEEITFEMYSKEKNHIKFPHTVACCRGERIWISLKGEIKKQAGKFTGNNAKNEKIAIQFVEEKKEEFLKEWHRIIDDQI